MEKSKTNPVAPTSRWMAAARAKETEREDRLFHDPLAADLAGEDGFDWLERMEPAAGGPGMYAVVRTRFFDDFLMEACESFGIRQVVLAAAGLDTRAFRLKWPSGVRLFEMDLPEVLDHKEDVVENAGAAPICERSMVRADLAQETWPKDLLGSGYDPDEPSVWLIEGLLFYLPRDAVHNLLDDIGELAAPGSRLGLDLMNWNLLFSPVAWPQLAALARRGAQGRFGTNAPEAFLARHGWEADATQPGEEGANFGRLPNRPAHRGLPGIPRSFLVTAERL
ncbi:MAG: SAM-dependent methyltransferase [Rubrobacter sp.]|nr:SAM-dependent methyltransferase [Rubrobacter sp.]